LRDDDYRNDKRADASFLIAPLGERIRSDNYAAVAHAVPVGLDAVGKERQAGIFARTHRRYVVLHSLCGLSFGSLGRVNDV
jgi:hypothetical protein